MSSTVQIIALAQQGMRRGEIAKTVNCKVNTVYSCIHEARKRGVAIAQFKKGSPKWAPLIVPSSVAKKLRLAAKARDLTPDQLAEKLLFAVTRDSLIAAVLDDGVSDV